MKKDLFKPTLVLAALAGILAAGTPLLAGAPAEKAERAKLRVGTFDSRAVVIAFAASETFDRQIKRLQQEREKAKAAGDEEKVKRLEAEGKNQQEQFHRQGFGTAPVDDILEHIKGELPAIAQRAGVDVIVSKWAITYRAADAQLVDVTDLIVEPFKPNERTKRFIREIRDQPPRPPEEIEKHQHDH
jgi:hypothetical protein